MNCEYIKVTNKDGVVNLEDLQNGLVLDIQAGDKIFIEQAVSQLKFEVVDGVNLKIEFPDGVVVVLNNIIELLDANANLEDGNIFEALLTKLEFLNDNVDFTALTQDQLALYSIDTYAELLELMQAAAAGNAVEDSVNYIQEEEDSDTFNRRSSRDDDTTNERSDFENRFTIEDDTATPEATVDVNDAATIEINDSSVVSFTEGEASAGDTVANFTTSDEDGDTVSVSVEPSAYYEVSGDSVVLTQAGADLINEGSDLPQFTVSATDGIQESPATDTATPDATVDVNDEMTTFEMNDVSNFTEDATSAGDTVTTVKTAPTDEDGGDITYSISDTTNYAIDSETGEVTLTQAGAELVNAGEELPAFNVTASSDNSSVTVENLDPAVTTVNDEMTTFEMNDVSNFTEDATSAGDTVTTVKTAPTDEDGGDITYSISDTTNYAIDSETGEVTLTQAGAELVNAGEELPAFNVTASSDNSSVTVENLDPAVTTVNDEMTTFEMNDVSNFTEDATSAGDTVTTVKTAPTDEDGGDITYSISDTTNYAIDSETGEVTLTQAGAELVNAGEELPAFNVTASSDNSSVTVENLDPAVTTVNDEMTTFEMNDVSNFTEDATSAGDTVTTVKTAPTDEDGGDITYSISDTTNYAIDSETGEVTLTQAGAELVNAGEELPAFNVTASSDNSSVTVENLDPAVTTVNDEMTTFEMNDVSNFTEDATSAGDTVTTVKTAPTDEDGGDITYSISDTTNYAIDSETGEVTLTQAGAELVNAGEELPAFNVTASSDNSSVTVENLDPAVTTVNDEMTTFEMNDVSNFTEDATSAGDTVTTVKTAPTDEDGGDITYSISDTTNYAIDSETGEVTLTQAGAELVNAGEELPAFNVTASSDNSSVTVENLDPAVTTVNDEMTTFEMNDVSNFTEDATSAGDTVTTVKTAPTDEDGGDITYSISDTTNYAIDSETGEVTLTQAGAELVNAGEELPAFNVTASSDNSSVTVENLDPAVTTVNDEMTTFEMNDVSNFTEDATSAGDTVTTVKTAPTDEDGGDITYSISDTTNYAIDSETGEVTLTQAGAELVNAGEELPAFNVTASSDNSSVTVENLDPAVTTVNDEMTTFEMNDVSNFTEDATSAGDTVTTVKTAPTDEDGGDITYSISDTTNYAIDSETGEVTLTQAGAELVNAGEELPAFNVTASSDNSSVTVENLDPAVTTVNDEMTTFEMNDVSNFTEDATSAGDTVTTVKTAPTDEDGGDITYSISDTTNYAIDSETGEVTLTQAGAELVNAGEELPAFNVTASSDNSSVTVENLDPAVTTVNDEMTTFEMNDVSNFTEDATSAGDTVTTVKTAPTDEDGGDITYSISDTTNYAIDSETGEVTLTQAGAELVNAGEELPAFNVTASSDNSSVTVENLDPAVTTVNDEMTTFEMNDVSNFTEDATSAGDTVTTVKTAPTDEDGGDITYSISDTTNYAIDSETGEVTLTQAGAELVNAGEELPAFNVTASSDNSSVTVENLDPAVTTVNDEMTTFEMNDVSNFTEDATSAGDTVTTVKTAPTDEDGGDITYSISDTTNYAIDSETGEVTLTQAGAELVNAGEELPAFNVTASSDNSSVTVENLDPAVTTVNDEMTTFEMNDVSNFTEDATSAGDTVTTVKTAPTDEDGGDITYSISDTTNYAIDSETGEVTLTQAGAELVNAGEELPAFNVTASSDNSSVTVENLDPAVTTVNDEMTTFEMNDVSNFTEDATSAGDTVTTVKTAPTDEDGGDITYSISDTTNYAIDSETGEVTLTQAGAELVNAGEELPAFNVTASSDNSSVTVENLDPAVTTVNDEMTTFEMNDVSNFTEDATSAGDTVTTVKTAPTDEDGGDITYSISDTTNYAIDSETGEVTLTQAGAELVNAGEELPAFNVTASSDNSSVTVENLDPAVTTVNDEMTTFEMNDVSNFTEDATSAGDTVTTVKTAPTDEDGGDITYSISDTTNYAIDSETGEVTLTQAGAELVNAGEELPAFNVTASSDNSSVTVENLDPAVTTVNDEMTTFEMNDVSNFTEDATSAGDTVTTVKTAPTDEDGGDITYSISDTTNYAIDSETGEVTLTQAGAELVNAGEELPAFNVTASSDNSSVTVENLDPAVTTVNDEMTTFEMNDVSNFTEDATSAGDTVTTVKTAPTDEDGGDITYSISDTTNYAIDSETGEVTLTQAGAELVNAGEELPAFNVTASSDNSSVTVENLDPAVTTVNDEMTTFEMNDVSNFTEDATSAGDTVTTVKTAPTDEDGGDITYSISDTTNYAIDSETGEVTLTQAGAELVNAGEELPAFNVTASSDNSSVTVENLDPAVTTVNDEMTTFEMNDVSNFTEDATSAGDTVTTVKTAPTDEDGGDITYSISDTTNYAIDSETGEVTLTQAGAELVNAGEELPAFNVTASSDNSSVTVENLDPAVTTVNDEMTTFEMNDVSNFTEDATSAGDTVTTVKTAPTDEDGGDITYSISDTTNYAIDSETGEVTLTQAGAELVNAGEELPAFNVTASSDNSSVTVENLDPAVTTVNDEMTTFEMNDVSNFTEDATSAGDTVTTVKTAPTDEDGGDITYSISDTTNYAIDSETGEVTLTQAGAELVNAGEELPAFNVTASSDNSSVTVENLDPAVTTVNDALELSVTPVESIVEDSVSEGSVIATSSASDEDGGDITFSLTSNPNDFFAIDDETGAVSLTQAGADHVNAGNDLPNFEVTASSTTGNTSASSVEVNPADTTDVDDATVLTVTAETLTEDVSEAGATVAIFNTTDEDSVVTVNFTQGSNDDGYYAIQGNAVVLTVAGEAFLDNGGVLPEVSLTTNTGVTQTATPTTVIELDTPEITNVVDTNGDLSEVIMSGTADNPGNTITIFDESGNAVATTTVQEDGTWSVDISDLPNTPLNDNEFFKVQESDALGNISDFSDVTHVWQGTWSNAQTEDSDDFVMAGSGNDTMAVNDNDVNDSVVIDGGDGTDTVTFSGNYEDYTITTDANGNTIVTESASTDSDGDGIGDVNEFRNVENIEFTDGVYDATNGTFTLNDTQAETQNDTATVGEDGTITINVLLNDETGSTITSVDTPTNSNGETLGNVSIVTVDGIEQIQFTPADNYDTLMEGESADISFTYHTEDSKGNEGEATVTVAIQGESNDLTYISEEAGYSNVVGYYEIDENGVPVSPATVVIDNQNGMDSGEHLADLNPDADYGFFVIANGANEVDGNSVITFDTTGDAPVLLINGQSPEHPVYHDTPEWNEDGMDHFIFTEEADGGMKIKIEDLPSSNSDDDFDDVVLHSDIVLPDKIDVTSDLAASSDTGVSDSDNITSDNTPTIDGTTEPGATVVITTAAGVAIGTAVANENGEYSITTDELPDGEQTLTITATDEAGNVDSTTETLTIDTSVSDMSELAITNIVDNEGDYSSVTMSGTGAEAGNIITIFDEDGSAVGTAIVDGDGNWNVDISDLSATGINDNEFFSVSETDSAGNETGQTDSTHYWHGSWSNAQTEDSDDFVMAGSGNDTMAVNDNDVNDSVVIDGGDGTDTVTFSGNYEDYTITTDANGNTIVTESASTDSDGDGIGDVNEFRNVENIEFTDGVYDATNGTFTLNDTQADDLTASIDVGSATEVIATNEIVDSATNEDEGIYERDGNYYQMQETTQVDTTALRELGYTMDSDGNFFAINDDAPKVLVEQEMTRDVTRVVDAEPIMKVATETTTFESLGEAHVDSGSHISEGASKTFTFAESTSNVEIDFSNFERGTATISFVDSDGNQVGDDIYQSSTNSSVGYSVPEGAVGFVVEADSGYGDRSLTIDTISYRGEPETVTVEAGGLVPDYDAMAEAGITWTETDDQTIVQTADITNIGDIGNGRVDGFNPEDHETSQVFDFGADMANRMVTITVDMDVQGSWDNNSTSTNDYFSVSANGTELDVNHYSNRTYGHDSDDVTYIGRGDSFTYEYQVYLDDNGQVQLDFMVASTADNEVVHVREIEVAYEGQTGWVQEVVETETYTESVLVDAPAEQVDASDIPGGVPYVSQEVQVEPNMTTQSEVTGFTYPVDISAALSDTDGSETLSVVISGVPTDGVLSEGVNNGDGTWTITVPEGATSLNDSLTLTVPSETDDFDLTIIATATESNGGDTNTVTDSDLVDIPVIEDTVAEAPTLDISIGDPVIIHSDRELSIEDDIGNYDGDDKLQNVSEYETYGDDTEGFDKIQNAYYNTLDGDDTVMVDNKIQDATVDTGADNDKILVDGKIQSTYVDMGSGDDELLITGDLKYSTVNMGSGNDVVNIDDFNNSTVNMGSDNDVIVLSGSQSEYTVSDYGNGSYSIQNSSGKYLTLTGTEAIVFDGDNSYIGDSELAESVMNALSSSTTYEYPVDLTAILTDTDGSETLSSVTISDLPAGVTVKESDNVTNNGDGTYSISVTSGVASAITLVSSYGLSNEQLNDIQASVTATESNSGDTATTTATEDLAEVAGLEIDISDVDSTVVNGDDFDVTGGDGDDTFELDSSDFTFETADGGSESDSFSASDISTEHDNLDGKIDGGDGYDTLIFEDDISLDFEQMAEDVKNMEAIDMKNQQANDLGDVSAADVLKMTDEDNVLKIIGDDADSIGLKEDEGWNKSDQKVTEDGETFDVWTNDDVTVFVDESITVDI